MDSATIINIINEFAVRPDFARRAIAQHKKWIEQQLGASLSEVVILESDLNLAQIGVELLLAIPPARCSKSSIARRLRPFVFTPAAFPPRQEVSA